MYAITSAKKGNDIFEIDAKGMCEKIETAKIIYERKMCATEEKITPRNGIHERSATSAEENMTSGIIGRMKIFATNEMSEKLSV